MTMATRDGRGALPDHTTAASSSSSLAGGTLQQRLKARYNVALQNLGDRVSQLRSAVDARQLARIVALKEALRSSHQYVAGMLQREEEQGATHEALLAKSEAALSSAGTCGTLPPFVDTFYCDAADNALASSRQRMLGERRRLMHMAVDLREVFAQRMMCIARCMAELEDEETRRQATLGEALRDLMLTLARIAYRGIPASHALAQRIIYEANQTALENYDGMQALATQLRGREILLQRQYASRLGALYGGCQRRMVRSSRCWLQTLLQTEQYRRPAARAAVLQRLAELSTRTQAEAANYMEALQGVVASLRSAREPAEGEAWQTCGGTTSAGWLRKLNRELDGAVFSADAADTVVDEWRVKTCVVVRNACAHGEALVAAAQEEEAARAASAAALVRELEQQIIRVYAPLGEDDADDEDRTAWRRASFSPCEVDAVYQGMELTNTGLVQALVAEARASLQPALLSLQAEGEWLCAAVAAGVRSNQGHLEQTLLTGSRSVLSLFQAATDHLITTATQVLGVSRQYDRSRYEARHDHEYHLADLEAQLKTIAASLLRAGSTAAADHLFAEGLACLEAISQAHVAFHKNFLSSADNAAAALRSAAATACGGLRTSTGLETAEETAARVARERRQRQAEKAPADAAQGQETEPHAYPKTRDDITSETRSSSTTPSSTAAADSLGEDVHYPQLISPDGVAYNVVAPLALLPESPQPPAAALPASSSGQQKLRKHTVAPAAGSGALAPSKGRASPVAEAFEQHYSPLLADAIRSPDGFVRSCDVTRWVEAVQLGLFEWAGALQAGAVDQFERRSAAARRGEEEATNVILRHHRRRPATFQASVYEVRVRELESRTSAGEKASARLHARVVGVDRTWQDIMSNPQDLAEDAAVLAELTSIKERMDGASAPHELQSLERHFMLLSERWLDTFAARGRAVVEDVVRQQQAIELACKDQLASRQSELEREQLPPDVTPEAALAADVLAERIRKLREELEQKVAGVMARVAEEKARRVQQLEDIRSSYEEASRRNAAELQLVDEIRAALAALKTDVQLLITRARADERHLLQTLDALATQLDVPVPHTRLAPVIRSLTERVGRLANSTSGGGVVGSAAADEYRAEAEERAALQSALEERRLEDTVVLQRAARSSPAAEILRVIDCLRLPLYTRGAALGVLAGAVELTAVDPTYYIDPPPLASADGATSVRAATAASSAAHHPGGHATARRQRRSGGPSRPAADPLPTVTTLHDQVLQWCAELKAKVHQLVQQHAALFPLRRGVAGTKECTTEEDVVALVQAFCGGQVSRVAAYVTAAAREYHKQVARVHVLALGTAHTLPRLTQALGAEAMQRRVAGVLDIMHSTRRRSAALQALHHDEVKLRLGEAAQRERLTHLGAVEQSRQAVTAALAALLWGSCLCEMQNEAGLHAARCAHVLRVYFQILRGLVMPELLQPLPDAEAVVGHHRGIKHLLRLRAQVKRMQEGRDEPHGGAAGGKTRHLQETMPLQRVSGGGGRAEKEAHGADGLPSFAQPEVAYGGLPLSSFRPLDAFNEQHPASTVPAPLAAGAYFPLQETATNSAGALARARRDTRTKSKKQDISALSPTLHAPRTRIYQDAAAWLKGAVTDLEAEASAGVELVNDLFAAWVGAEEQWLERWRLVMMRLRHDDVHVMM